MYIDHSANCAFRKFKSSKAAHFPVLPCHKLSKAVTKTTKITRQVNSTEKESVLIFK